MMDYPEAWSYLDKLQFFKIKLGLESMRDFLALVGNPQQNLNFLHIAGTNGKGSVASFLRAILTRAGYKTGLYTSPHLSSVRERFRIDERFISEEAFARQASLICEALGERQITYFEFTTALALLWFAEENVDLAILEVGMGGRLDATNVITPLVSVITNVSMDHEQYLGDTLAAVAAEKAGIVKPGVPVVSGTGSDDSLEVVAGVCRERGAPLYLLGRDFSVGDEADGTWSCGLPSGKVYQGLRCGLAGDHQKDNAALALMALHIVAGRFPVSAEAIREGLLAVTWPGRLEYFCLADGKTVAFPGLAGKVYDKKLRRYLLDGAHNPAGALSLRAALQAGFPRQRLILVWGAMADKDLAGTLGLVAPLADLIVFTRPESERSATQEELAANLAGEDRGKVRVAATVAGALELAADLATGEDLICVAGSLYLVGAARKIFIGEVAP